MACTDSILLERIVGNLLSNAIRYTEVGGVLLTLRNAHGSKGLWLEVWDTGIGIEDSDRVQIFNPYVQIGNAERDRSKGLGLGLAIVSHLVTLLGLQFELKSQPQRGSCFRLYLPFGICTVQQSADAEPQRRVSPVSPARLQGRRILLVEDDPMALQAMQILLGGWGVDLRCASLGDASVLAHCSADWTPECVLCDFRLPGVLDGIAVLGLVLDRYPDAVGILQTGELAKRVMAQAEEAGYMVLFKPIDPIILGSTLNAIFEETSV
jgi:CheY-like chemotaxis protein